MNKLIWLLTEIFPSVAISSEMNSDEYLMRGLKKDLFQLIILHEKPIDENLFAKKKSAVKNFILSCRRIINLPIKREFFLKN